MNVESLEISTPPMNDERIETPAVDVAHSVAEDSEQTQGSPIDEGTDASLLGAEEHSQPTTHPYVQRAEEDLKLAETELLKIKRPMQARILDANVEEREREARNRNQWAKDAHNEKRTLTQKVLGRNKEPEAEPYSENEIAHERALDEKARIESMTSLERAKEAEDNFVRDMRSTTGSGDISQYLELRKRVDQAAEALDTERSLIMVEDPVKAEKIANAEKKYQESAIELDKLGLKERAESVREQAHRAALEVALRYEAEDRPIKELMKRAVEEAILSSVLAPGKAITLDIFDRKGRTGGLGLGGNNPLFREHFDYRSKVHLTDEYIRMVYETLGFDFSKRILTSDDKPSGFNGLYSRYDVSNDDYRVVEIHTFYGASANDPADSDEPSQIKFRIIKIPAKQSQENDEQV